MKDLGVTLDSHLKYDTHITELVSSCLSKLCQINRVRHLLDRETLSLIIHSLVLSKIFYCSVVWSNTAAKNVEKLQLVQNFAARIITGKSKFDHISPILQELGWMTVHNRLIYRDTLQIYKCLNDLSPRYLGELFKQRASVHQYSTRQTHDLIIPKCQTSIGQKTFHYRAVKLWNNLDDKIKSIENIREFKLELKKHIFSN